MSLLDSWLVPALPNEVLQSCNKRQEDCRGWDRSDRLKDVESDYDILRLSDDKDFKDLTITRMVVVILQ